MEPTSNPTPTSSTMPESTPNSVSMSNSASMPVSDSTTSIEPSPASGQSSSPIASGSVVTPPPAVNPIINPTGNASSSSPFQPGISGIAATDPIMTPTPPKAPDPVEEELKAPMKAAEPVPGSIGSAISRPSSETIATEASMESNGSFENFSEKKIQNVSFNDPAVESNAVSENKEISVKKKPQDKKTLIILGVIAAIVVIALLAVLAIQFIGGNS